MRRGHAERDTYSLWFICLISQKNVLRCIPAIYIALIISANTDSMDCFVRAHGRSVVQLKHSLNGSCAVTVQYVQHRVLTLQFLSPCKTFSWVAVHSRLWVMKTSIYVIIRYVFYICTVLNAASAIDLCSCGLIQTYWENDHHTNTNHFTNADCSNCKIHI